ncbi:hypothetical protein [Marinobacter alexandrii]|jgi:hypothetical protein|uniref:hypothetical protein n=2 Tax=Marinobacter alexandrii TaxID=2570351 RepID=UPI001FFE94D6|nr:hypothetical protein [Marinobacter alexandrii]MCK2151064.1 hypothetical protein [Marinobacter alexandrii]
MADVAVVLEQGGLAQALAGSMWWYPLINAGHILGIALLVGGIVPLDLRLLGLWSSLPLQPFWRVLRTTAAVGLALAVTTGSLMFITRATEYLESFWFRAKLLALLLGLVNIVVVMARYTAGPGDGAVSLGLRAGALVSLAVWLLVLVLGRFVGYF